MENNPDSPDSLSGDQLTVDLLSPRSKRRRLVINDLNDVDRREQSTPDVNNKSSSSNNNNDVGFVLMDDEHQENGTEEEDEVCILI